jgi:TPR repeat protein
VKKKFCLLLLVICVCLSPRPVQAGDLEEGIKAWFEFDFDRAVDLLKPLAESGNPDAQLYLAIMYHFGEGVAQDYGETVRWLTRASEQGHAEAQYNLGYIYLLGEIVPTDYPTAEHWLLKSAEGGYAATQHMLGVLYSHGECLPERDFYAGFPISRMKGNWKKIFPRDLVRAYAWLELAESQKFPHAKVFKENLAKLMAPEEIEAGQKLSRERSPRLPPQPE